MDLPTAANALGGEVTGRGILCPGPGHSPHDRSLSVSFDSSAPEGFAIHSFAGDPFDECRDHVKQLLGMASANRNFFTDRAARKHQKRRPQPRDQSRTGFAQSIWREAKPAVGSPVEDYLRDRDLKLVPQLLELRYHPRCPFKGDKVGAMIAPMTNAVTAEFRGVHRTRLAPKDKAMLGPAKDAVVRLCPDHEVTSRLHICEGIETGLALLAMGFKPLWCALSAGGIAAFPILDGVESLTIFADRDANQAGERAALDCGDRWRAAGREVRVLAPPKVGTDFADYRGAS